MPPNNPMTEGEALAVLRRLKDALPDVGLNGWMEGVHAVDVAIAALTAHTAASGWEVVAWQYKDADWKEWASITREQFDKYTSMPQSDSWTVRALYTAPPAAVPADALERLVADWAAEIEMADENSADRFMRGAATAQIKCRHELAALIPKGAV